MFVCLESLTLTFTCNFLAYFKFHNDWGWVIGKIKQNELDCRDTTSFSFLSIVYVATDGMDANSLRVRRSKGKGKGIKARDHARGLLSFLSRARPNSPFSFQRRPHRLRCKWLKLEKKVGPIMPFQHTCTEKLEGSRGGAVVRALTSHQCGPGSNPGVDAICWLSWLLVLSLAPRGFSPGTPVFPSPQKPTFPNSNSTRNQVDRAKNHYVDVLPANRYLFRKITKKNCYG